MSRLSTNHLLAAWRFLSFSPCFFISRIGIEDYREDTTNESTSTTHGTVILYTHYSSALISFSEVSEIVISLYIMTYSLRICAEKIEKATGWG